MASQSHFLFFRCRCSHLRSPPRRSAPAWPYLLSTGSALPVAPTHSPGLRLASFAARRGNPRALRGAMALDGQLVHDLGAAAVTASVALALLFFWAEIAKRRIFEQKLNRKLVHISVGLVFMAFWPLFSSGSQAPFLAALAPGMNIFRMLFLGLGIWKNEAMVESMSRHGHYRELLKGPLYYACTLTLATSILWRTSPVAIAAVCNLCAGDGVADIVGRRYGTQKLPYNQNKSFAGSIAMAAAGFIASIVYMRYFSMLGFVNESWGMVIGFLIVSLAAAFIESLPISSELDDNLTVPLTSVLVGSLVL